MVTPWRISSWDPKITQWKRKIIWTKPPFLGFKKSVASSGFTRTWQILRWKKPLIRSPFIPTSWDIQAMAGWREWCLLNGALGDIDQILQSYRTWGSVWKEPLKAEPQDMWVWGFIHTDPTTRCDWMSRVRIWSYLQVDPWNLAKTSEKGKDRFPLPPFFRGKPAYSVLNRRPSPTNLKLHCKFLPVVSRKLVCCGRQSGSLPGVLRWWIVIT